jgi:hypothetical protein
LSILIDDALAGHDPRTVLSLYTAPVDDNPFAEETIRKANPALGDFLNIKEVMQTAKAAHRGHAGANSGARFRMESVRHSP